MKHDCNDDFCHRLSYLFGMPYVPSKIKTVHDHLRSQFGYISTQFLLHCAQNLRRGYAGEYEPQFERAQNVRFRFKPESFRDRKLSLITGDVNCLWHRDSIDTMYEWLLRAPKSDRPRWMRKHVIPSFAHQDLLWGTGAPKDVFGRILTGLRD